VDYGVIEAANERLARAHSAPVVRWDVGRLVARPCEDPPERWVSVGDRVRYDTLLRMPKSVLSTTDKRFLESVRSRRPLPGAG
jgi:hypothetical protein